jgi:hypothetical protein
MNLPGFFGRGSTSSSAGQICSCKAIGSRPDAGPTSGKGRETEPKKIKVVKLNQIRFNQIEIIGVRSSREANFLQVWRSCYGYPWILSLSGIKDTEGAK